jgi:hypothetical protein
MVSPGAVISLFQGELSSIRPLGLPTAMALAV